MGTRIWALERSLKRAGVVALAGSPRTGRQKQVASRCLRLVSGLHTLAYIHTGTHIYVCPLAQSHTHMHAHSHTEENHNSARRWNCILEPQGFSIVKKKGRLAISGRAGEDGSKGVLTRQAAHHGFMGYCYISQWLFHITNSGVHSLKENKNFYDSGGWSKRTTHLLLVWVILY